MLPEEIESQFSLSGGHDRCPEDSLDRSHRRVELSICWRGCVVSPLCVLKRSLISLRWDVIQSKKGSRVALLVFHTPFSLKRGTCFRRGPPPEPLNPLRCVLLSVVVAYTTQVVAPVLSMKVRLHHQSTQRCLCSQLRQTGVSERTAVR